MAAAILPQTNGDSRFLIRSKVKALNMNEVMNVHVFLAKNWTRSFKLFWTMTYCSLHSWHSDTSKSSLFLIAIVLKKLNVAWTFRFFLIAIWPRSSMFFLIVIWSRSSTFLVIVIWSWSLIVWVDRDRDRDRARFFDVIVSWSFLFFFDRDLIAIVILLVERDRDRERSSLGWTRK